MTASLAEKPRSPISLLRREHKDLLDKLASNSRTQVRCCAVAMISYLKHWHEWKKLRYPTCWVYQPLRDIREDLMGAYTLHVIRAALDLLEKLGFLSIRKNARQENRRNGQDKTHQYLLHEDRIEEALEKLYSPKKAKTRKNSPVDKAETSGINSGTPGINFETSRFTVETHTQIPSTDSCTDSCSLKQEREEINFVPELEDPWEAEDEVEQDLTTSFDDRPEISQEQEVKSEDQFSAVSASKCDEVPQTDVNTATCVEVVQTDVKPLPKLKSESVALHSRAERTSGFRSQEEREDFYQALLVLGKGKGDVLSPVAWASAIVKGINAGEPCEYLNEYRRGELLGRCEQQEWEVAPGQPFEQFVTYLKTRSKKTGMTDEEAIASSYQQLKNVNLARAQWESFKRTIDRCAEDWEKQKQLGVSSAYVPPELLPDRKVSLEEAASAMASLQAGCIQLQVQGLAESAKLNSATAELEPAKELVTESAVVELEPTTADADVDGLEPAKELASEPAVTEPIAPPLPLSELQQRLDGGKLAASLARRVIEANPEWYVMDEELNLVLPAGEEIPSLEHLRSLLSNPITAQKLAELIEAHPDWGFWIDEFGELWEF